MSENAPSQVGVWITRVAGVTFVLIGVARIRVFPVSSWPLAVTVLTIAAGVGMLFLLNAARRLGMLIAALHAIAIIGALARTEAGDHPAMGMKVVYGLLAWSIVIFVALWLPTAHKACRPLWKRTK